MAMLTSNMAMAKIEGNEDDFDDEDEVIGSVERVNGEYSASDYIEIDGIPETEIEENSKYGEAEKYRRSSLALILITHSSEKYAREIESQFYQIVPPERYNSHDISVRVIHATSKNMSAKKIIKTLENQQVAKQLVSRWFNRDPYSGICNMNLIGERGLYNASKEDNDLAQMTIRKEAMLRDAGEELIQNTFVLVCDLKYHDKQKTSQVFSGLMQVGAAILDSYAQNTTNVTKAQTFQNFSNLANVSSQAVADIGGFSVNVEAHLLRLDWNKDLSNLMYNSYWVDESTPADEAMRRKQAYDNDRKSFKLSYIGENRSQAGRTVSASASDLNLVVRDVCSNAVNISVNNLAKQYPVFKPKAPFYCGNDGKYYSYIGTKEGVNNFSKYEVVEPYFDKKGQINYKRKAVLKTQYNDIWKNSKTYITNASDSIRGTAFTYAKGSRDICNQGFLIREMGKTGFQYKKHRLYTDMFIGKGYVSSSEKEKIMGKPKSYEKNKSKAKCSPIIYGINVGGIWNFHRNIAWDYLGFHFGGGSKEEGGKTYSSKGTMMVASITTGIIFRTNPLNKKGGWSFYLWPQVGAGYNHVKVVSSYTTSHSYKLNWEEKEKTVYYDWNIRAGINITERLFVGLNYALHRRAFCIGYQF